jgi:hypothetical protein
MRPTFSPGDMIVVSPEPMRSLRVGDVITFITPTAGHPVETHRVVNILRAGAEPIVQTRGDTNNTIDPWRAQLHGSTVWRYRFRLPAFAYPLLALRSPGPLGDDADAPAPSGAVGAHAVVVPVPAHGVDECVAGGHCSSARSASRLRSSRRWPSRAGPPPRQPGHCPCRRRRCGADRCCSNDFGLHQARPDDDSGRGVVDGDEVGVCPWLHDQAGHRRRRPVHRHDRDPGDQHQLLRRRRGNVRVVGEPEFERRNRANRPTRTATAAPSG